MWAVRAAMENCGRRYKYLASNPSAIRFKLIHTSPFSFFIPVSHSERPHFVFAVANPFVLSFPLMKNASPDAEAFGISLIASLCEKSQILSQIRLSGCGGPQSHSSFKPAFLCDYEPASEHCLLLSSIRLLTMATSAEDEGDDVGLISDGSDFDIEFTDGEELRRLLPAERNDLLGGMEGGGSGGDGGEGGAD